MKRISWASYKKVSDRFFKRLQFVKNVYCKSSVEIATNFYWRRTRESELGSKSGFFSWIGLISEVLSPRSVSQSPPSMPVPQSLYQRQLKFPKIEFLLTAPVTFESGLWSEIPGAKFRVWSWTFEPATKNDGRTNRGGVLLARKPPLIFAIFYFYWRRPVEKSDRGVVCIFLYFYWRFNIWFDQIFWPN